MSSYIGKININNTEYPIAQSLFGTCNTTANTATKVVTCADFDTLISGIVINVYFTYANTESSISLNVNSTGNKIVYVDNNSSILWDAGATKSFVYYNNQWRLINPTSVGTTYSAATTAVAGLMSAADKIKLNGITTGASTYAAGSGLSLSGTTFNHTNSITASSVGSSVATSGATLDVPYAKYDAQGHITEKGVHVHTIGSLAASAITSGTFATARIPNLPTSIITSGTFATARIPNLPASIITSGTLGTAILPTVPIAKGGTGATTAAAARTALGLGSAAVASTSASVGNNTNLPTGAAIQSYVTGLGYTSNTGTVTSIATGTGLTGGPVTSSGTISHQTGIGTTGTVGPSATSSGQTVAIPYATYDSMGHITAKGTYNHTVNSLPASAISSGTFATARIPSLPASIITSGTFATARIPNLPTSIITSGTFATARIPNLPTSIITSGTFSTARLPVSTSVGNNNNLPTGAAIQTYVTGLGYEANQNAFTTVKVGTTDLVADSKTDTLTITAGNNITLTPTASSDSFSIAATNTTYTVATTSANGLMSSTDKLKLDKSLGLEGIVIGSDGVSIFDSNPAPPGYAFWLDEGSNISFLPPSTFGGGVKVKISATDTKYSAGSGLSLSGTNSTVIGHSNSITASSVGSSVASTGSTVAIPYITYNGTGHITAAGTKVHTFEGGGGGSSSNRATLFTGDSTGNVTLSSSAANYDLLEIFYEGYNGFNPRTMKILNPNGRTIHLHIIETAGSDGMRIRVAKYTISGISIVSESSWSGYYLFDPSGSFTSTLGTNVIHITRVDGIIDSTIESGMGDKY